METYSFRTVDELCGRIEEALKGLPIPEPTSREEMLATDYLWRLEIFWTCGQVIEHYRSVRLLIDQGLHRAAAALSRSIHESKIRFEYLVHNEGELLDWFEWQWSRDYHQFKDELRYDIMLSGETPNRLHEDIHSIVGLLGKVPRKPSHPWKSVKEMLNDKHETMEAGEAQRIYRWLFTDLSQYVHISNNYEPSARLTTWLTETSVLTTFIRAMRLCQEKQIIDPPADEIAERCYEALLGLSDNLRVQLNAIRPR